MTADRARLAGLAAYPFVGLIVASIILGGTKLTGHSSGATVIAYYHAHRGQELANAIVIDVSIVVGLFFFGAVRRHLRRAETAEWLAAAGFGGAILFAGGAVLESGSVWALADRPGGLSEGTAQTLNLVPSDFATVMIGTGIAAMLFASGAAILVGRTLPAWLGWFALAAAVVALVPWIEFVALVAVALWSLAVGTLVYRQGDVPETRSVPAGVF